MFFIIGIVFSVSVSAGLIEDLPAGHWAEVPDSRLDAVNPQDDSAVNPNYPGGAPWHGVEGISAVMADWSGGAFDSKRDRLLVWGGGHSGYAGNEIYAFDLNTFKWSLLTDPSYPFTADDDASAPDIAYNPDGTPVSRHTYNYLQYVPETDGFYTFGGAGFYPSGQTGTYHTDCFNLTSMRWEKKADISTLHTNMNCIGAISAYDPETGLCWYRASNMGPLFSYDPITDAWTDHGGSAYVSYDHTAAIDPVRRKMVGLGSGYGDAFHPGVAQVVEWDIGNPGAGDIPAVVLQTTGDTGVFLNGPETPGFEYDPVSGQFVAWIRGADVYTLDLDAGVWTRHPPAAANTVVPTLPKEQGTYGRFRYVPSRNVFVLVNSVDENVFIYRLTEGSGTGETRRGKNGAGKVELRISPNPFNLVTRITVTGAKKGGRLVVYDLKGRVAARLPLENGQAIWNAAGRAAGTYLVEFIDGHKKFRTRISFIK